MVLSKTSKHKPGKLAHPLTQLDRTSGPARLLSQTPHFVVMPRGPIRASQFEKPCSRAGAEELLLLGAQESIFEALRPCGLGCSYSTALPWLQSTAQRPLHKGGSTKRRWRLGSPPGCGCRPRPGSLTARLIVFRLQSQVSEDVGLSRKDSEPLPPRQRGSNPFICSTAQVFLVARSV